MDRLPNLKALQAFRFAGEAESFKAAAERLHVTQAAISQQIKTLEEQLGVSLFKRRPREVALTAEGRQLLASISQGFSIIEQGVIKLTGDPTPTQLNISTLPSFASRWLVPRLGSFQNSAPELTVNLTPALHLESFEGDHLDLAIRFGKGHYPGLQSVKLFDEYLIPACHPSLIDNSVSLKQQISKMSLLTDDSPDLADAWNQFKNMSGINFHDDASKLQVNDSTLLVEAVLAAQGLSLLRFSLIYELLDRGQLICPLPVWIKSDFDYYLVAPPSHFKRKKVQNFERWLDSEFAITKTRWTDFTDSFSK